MSISNEFPTILQENAIFQATNCEDIARDQTVPDEVPNGNPWGFQKELNSIPYRSVISTAERCSYKRCLPFHRQTGQSPQQVFQGGEEEKVQTSSAAQPRPPGGPLAETSQYQTRNIIVLQVDRALQHQDHEINPK